MHYVIIENHILGPEILHYLSIYTALSPEWWEVRQSTLPFPEPFELSMVWSWPPSDSPLVVSTDHQLRCSVVIRKVTPVRVNLTSHNTQKTGKSLDVVQWRFQVTHRQDANTEDKRHRENIHSFFLIPLSSHLHRPEHFFWPIRCPFSLFS
jgi:hypothetical protein